MQGLRDELRGEFKKMKKEMLKFTLIFIVIFIVVIITLGWLILQFQYEVVEGNVENNRKYDYNRIQDVPADSVISMDFASGGGNQILLLDSYNLERYQNEESFIAVCGDRRGIDKKTCHVDSSGTYYIVIEANGGTKYHYTVFIHPPVHKIILSFGIPLVLIVGIQTLKCNNNLIRETASLKEEIVDLKKELVEMKKVDKG